jgi:hypothetical protein
MIDIKQCFLWNENGIEHAIHFDTLQIYIIYSYHQQIINGRRKQTGNYIA